MKMEREDGEEEQTDASDLWGLSVSFLSIILLPIVGNAAEHAGAIVFAFKNKLDISLTVALGSATQIAMFVVPLCVIIAWIIPINMDLNFNLLETGSLALAIIVTGFTLQDRTSHYMKGVVLLLCYIVIGASFFVQRTPFNNQVDALAYLLSLPEMKNGGIDPNQKSYSNSKVYIACFNDVLIHLLF
ncbi:Vacuolar cation/proton exchanger 3 [Glycine soja]